MVSFDSALRLMNDDSARQEGPFVRQRDDELHLLIGIASRDAAGRMDADPARTHVPGEKLVETMWPHDLDFDRFVMSRCGPVLVTIGSHDGGGR